LNTVLSLKDVNVCLQRNPIVNAASLELNKGDILGLVGPSGCGKTTLLNAIAGFIEISAGTIQLPNEVSVSVNNEIAAEKRNVGMIFQDYALFPHLTVKQNITFGVSTLSKTEQTDRARELLTLLSLDEHGEKYPHQLSGGQQQRVAIARALAPQPELLLFDEPFSNIDARLKNELIHELRALLKSLSISAIFVTHNKDEVFSFADKMAVMHNGHILQFGEPNDIYQRPNSWQVADFLQVGNWLPVAVTHEGGKTALGTFECDPDQITNSESPLLLVRAHQLEIKGNTDANCQINTVRSNEYGYHYIVSTLSEESCLNIDNLSVFSRMPYHEGDKIRIDTLIHEVQIFSAN